MNAKMIELIQSANFGKAENRIELANLLRSESRDREADALLNADLQDPVHFNQWLGQLRWLVFGGPPLHARQGEAPGAPAAAEWIYRVAADVLNAMDDDVAPRVVEGFAHHLHTWGDTVRAEQVILAWWRFRKSLGQTEQLANVRIILEAA